MKDRLLQLLEKERISSAEFADRIGVQRSNVSHILNGRNNPGYSFIQKVLESFPRINSRWLITGEGSMETSSQVNSKLPERDLFSIADRSVSEPVKRAETEGSTLKDQPIEKVENQLVSKKIASVAVSKKIVRVLLFYNDNTFEDFSPTDKL
jgi:transcriptional regulator with XRE-family HTH domain